MKVKISFGELAVVREALSASTAGQCPVCGAIFRNHGVMCEIGRAKKILDRYLATPPDQIESALKESIREVQCRKRNTPTSGQ